jgi:hypothetical protein
VLRLGDYSNDTLRQIVVFGHDSAYYPNLAPAENLQRRDLEQLERAQNSSDG